MRATLKPKPRYVTPATRMGRRSEGGCDGAIVDAKTPVNRVGKIGKIQRGLIDLIESFAPWKITVYCITDDERARAA